MAAFRWACGPTWDRELSDAATANIVIDFLSLDNSWRLLYNVVPMVPVIHNTQPIFF